MTDTKHPNSTDETDAADANEAEVNEVEANESSESLDTSSPDSEASEMEDSVEQSNESPKPALANREAEPMNPEDDANSQEAKVEESIVDESAVDESINHEQGVDDGAAAANQYAEAKSGESDSTEGESNGAGESEDDQSPTFKHLEDAKAQFAQEGQSEMPFALVQGQAMTQLPLDLYIPPDALEVILEQFEGPLDLLLYLIRKQNLDILEVNVAEITDQYVGYVEMMMSVQLELAGDYLVMAAMLAEIKSRMLLPRTESEDGEEEEADPRAELIRRLQEYERFKQAAEDLDEMPRLGRDNFEVSAKAPEYTAEKQHPDVDMKEIILAFAEVLKRAERFEEHEVAREALSTRERMSGILERLRSGQFAPFVSLFTVEEGRNGVVTTFLAVLELIKEKLIDIVQTEEFGPIHVKAKDDESATELQ